MLILRRCDIPCGSKSATSARASGVRCLSEAAISFIQVSHLLWGSGLCPLGHLRFIPIVSCGVWAIRNELPARWAVRMRRAAEVAAKTGTLEADGCPRDWTEEVVRSMTIGGWIVVNRTRTCIIALVAMLLSLWLCARMTLGAQMNGGASERTLALRIIGPEGAPVAGAKVGTGLNIFEQSQGHPPQTILMWLRGQKRHWPFYSDTEGLIELTDADAEHRNFYVQYEPRGWVGYKQVLEGSTGSRVDIRLEPACRVHGQLTSSGFDRLGHPLEKTVAFLYDSRGELVMYFVSEQGRYEFLLPGGRYELECFGEGPPGIETARLRWSVVVESDQQDLDAGLVDLPPTRLAELCGTPAPELLGIVDWRGSQPLELSRLTGNVVVLVFWGSWSRPCLKTMPQLMELHDLWADQGVVIIGVHDNSVSNVAELDANLAEAHRLYWGRRELLFPVGIDSGKGWGAVHETYGIDQWPAVVVIDPQGNVAGTFSPWGPLEAVLAQMLSEQ